MKYYIKVEYGDKYDTSYNTLQEAVASLKEYIEEGWTGLIIVNENNDEYYI